MASSLQRLSALTGSQLRRQALTRGFRSTSARNAAQAMTMPAMSPTMTEGAIASWRVKEGEAFSTGDVLLEIETDKAQMDVEAQDDGILAKIVVPAGVKGVAVGTRIAVLAEVGDDLSTLEIPSDSAAPASAATKSPVESTPKAAKAAPIPGCPQHPSPSVMNLLHAHGLDATTIVGTGPKGRLLKGDILAHLGKIGSSVPADLSARITSLTKLDLSNIKAAAPRKAPAPPPPAPAPKKAVPPPPPPPPPQERGISLSVNLAELSRVQSRLQRSQGITISLSSIIAKATAAANASLPPVKTPPTQDELFNDLLDIPNPPRKPTAGKFQPIISPLPVKGAAAVAVVRAPAGDIFDLLIGNAPAGVVVKKVGEGPREGILAGGENLVSVKAAPGEEERASVFLERVKRLLEERVEELVGGGGF